MLLIALRNVLDSGVHQIGDELGRLRQAVVVTATAQPPDRTRVSAPLRNF
jgi:hypothetical protein